jgi:hypothetical protein
MLAVLSLEFIGETYHAHKRDGSRPDLIARYGQLLGRDTSRPWVAKLSGIDAGGSFHREFVRAQIDYSRANKTGSRGVYLYYPLQDGLYEVNKRESWTKVRRYFIRVEDTRIEEIEREEIMQWLLTRSGLSQG